ncbi:branched-chain amino acid ABC transporter permease [Thermodesulfobacteriota bacterium]
MLLEQLISGLATGCVYALVALGFVLIYKTTEVLNFAQGELLMIGAFMGFTFISLFKLPLLLSLVCTLAFMAFFGIIIERIFLRPLIGQPPFALLMTTVGLATIIRTLAGMIWTHDAVRFPDIFSEEPVSLLGSAVAPIHIGVIIASLLLVIILGLFFKFVNLGIALRACGLNQLATVYMGISIKRTFTIAWALSAMVSTVAGILLAPIAFLSTNLGLIMFKAFPAAMIGGFTSIPGAIIGGIIIGIAENMAGIFLPGGFKTAFAPALLILVLLIRPAGILGKPEHKRV